MEICHTIAQCVKMKITLLQTLQHQCVRKLLDINPMAIRHQSTYARHLILKNNKEYRHATSSDGSSSAIRVRLLYEVASALSLSCELSRYTYNFRHTSYPGICLYGCAQPPTRPFVSQHLPRIPAGNPNQHPFAGSLEGF